MIISRDEIRFNNTSYIDPFSRVFGYDGNIYRGVVPEKADFYREIFKSRWYGKLADKGRIVSAMETDMEVEGFGAVFKHRRIPFLTYCTEWPPHLLKKSAILTLELALELADHDLTLQDAYPWNVLFEGTNPVFIDAGSIVPPHEKYLWVPYQQFCQFFLFPLYLYGAGIGSPVRMSFLNYFDGISYDLCSRMLPLSYKLTHPGVFNFLEFPRLMSSLISGMKLEKTMEKAVENNVNINRKEARISLLAGLLRHVKSLRIPLKKTVWTDYIQGDLSLEKNAGWSLKQNTVSEILEKTRPSSVVDMAANKGWFTQMAAKKGIPGIAFDIDEDCIGGLCDDLDKNGLPVIPLVLNALNPTPAFGWCLKQFPSALDRLKGEMAFAFALMHHLVFTQWQNFDRLIEALDCFTTRWLLVEFVPKDDEKSQILLERKDDAFDWYTLDNFLNALSKRYIKTEVFESHPPGRKLILCEK